jgi:hypothetical protein
MSVIVLIVDIDGVEFVPSKCYPPIRGHRNRISDWLSAKAMKSKPREVHVLRLGCIVEEFQHLKDPTSLIGPETARVIIDSKSH